MMRILFVCHGNICRSPMAEFILKDMLTKLGREREFSVESRATSTEEIWRGVGNPVYPPARAELAKHGMTRTDKEVCDSTSAKETRSMLIMDDNSLGISSVNSTVLANRANIGFSEKESKDED